MAYELLPLDEAQRKIIKDNETEALPVIMQKVWPGCKADLRTTEGRTLKAFMAGENIPFERPLELVVEKPKVDPTEILTEEHKRKIEELAPRIRKDGGALELARMLFDNPKLTALNREAKAVFAYLRQIDPDAILNNDEPVEDKNYVPPTSIIHLMGIANNFLKTGSGTKIYSPNSLGPNEKKCLEKLLSYMSVYRFIYLASQYERKVDRDLFISTFIRWAHDKPDLTEIDIDKMISAAEETTNITQIARTIQRIDKLHEEIMQAGGVITENGVTRKFGANDVELLNTVRTKYDTAKKNLRDLMSELEESRAEREEGRNKKFTSILDLLNLWQSNENDFRTKMLESGKQEKAEDAAEVEKLSGVEELVALISGQTKDEARR